MHSREFQVNSKERLFNSRYMTMKSFAIKRCLILSTCGGGLSFSMKELCENNPINLKCTADALFLCRIQSEGLLNTIRS